ncbi:MAG: TonB family protein [Acidobacteriota bacterium]|nr:TonB family protein [Acidobacteriota bacterium]
MTMKSDFPRIPGYWIERELGRGGMGIVYLAHEGKLDRMVAIKVVELLNMQAGEQAERFINESRTAARLQHSNIVPIYDVGLEGNLYYMAVEYFPGGTLRDLLNAGPIPGGALLVVERLADALHYAHSLGFIHRDVKPENIIFRRDGTPVLSDFGIARAVDAITRLTQAGKAVGTPHYMSPEQARGLDLDGRADLYSLGVVFYEMLTGDVPYEAQDNIAVAIKHIQEPIPGLPPHLSHFQSLLEKMMAKDREARVQTGEELSRLIQEMQDKEKAWPFLTAGRETTADPAGDGRRAGRAKKAGKKKLTGKTAKQGTYGAILKKMKFLVSSLAGALVFALVLIVILLARGGREVAKDSVLRPSGSDAVLTEDLSALSDREYHDYLSKARASLDRGDLEDAGMKIALAETIVKGGVESESLKTLIEQAETARRAEKRRQDQARRTADKPVRVEEPRQEDLKAHEADDAAWSMAAAVGTEESLKSYIENYPAGRYVADAWKRIEDLRTAARERTKEEERKKSEDADRSVEDLPETKASRGDLVPLADVDTEPLAITSPEPAYPESARRFRIEGAVVVDMLVSESGDVIDVRTIKGIDGYTAFERAAESAVRKWRFRPAIKDGVPVKVWKSQTFVFKTGG